MSLTYVSVILQLIHALASWILAWEFDQMVFVDKFTVDRIYIVLAIKLLTLLSWEFLVGLACTAIGTYATMLC